MIPISLEPTSSRTSVQCSTAEVQTLGLSPNTAPHSCPFSQITYQAIPGQASVTESTMSIPPSPTRHHPDCQPTLVLHGMIVTPLTSGSRDLYHVSPANKYRTSRIDDLTALGTGIRHWFESSRTRLYIPPSFHYALDA